MAKKQTKKQAFRFRWFVIGLIGALLAAPNATIIKSTLGDMDPFLFNALRFGILALITIPFVLLGLRKINRKNLQYALIAGIAMSVAVMTFVWAIKTSQASYVAILSLMAPIMLIIYSSRLTGEKISTRAAAGISLAALGALTIVGLPIALSQDAAFQFYPLATVLIVLDCLIFPLATIYSKKSNDAGLPLTTVLGISAIIIFVTNAVVAGFVMDWSFAAKSLSGSDWAAVVYSAVAVIFLARLIAIATYERIGSAATSGIAYIETMLAVIIPLLVLSERLSVAVVLGGCLILGGVYVSEHHRSKHHKHFRIFRSH